MKRSLIKASCILATAAALLIGSPAQADILYDSTGAPRYAHPDDVASGLPLSFNVNSFPGASGDILWDDVAINVGSTVNPTVAVTRLTFDILRIANAPAVNLQIYWANMVPDNGINRGTNTFPFDSPIDDPGTPNLIGTISVPLPQGTTAGRQLVTIGNGTDVLFTTGILNTSTPDFNFNTDTFPVGTHPGYGYFFVGMKISSTLQDNLWVIASHPQNLYFVTDDFQDDVPSTVDEFFFDLDDLDQPILGTMSMKVEGVLVPEPASLAVVGMATLALLTRRRTA